MRILFIVLSILLLSCHSNQPIPLDTLVVGIENFPLESDPRLARDSISQKINRLVYNGLLKKDDNLELVPDLATNFQIVDPTTYKFSLRDDVVFHNGKRLTSADVKATYESMMGKNIKSIFKGSLKIIDEILTPDQHTVIFKLKRPNSPFLTLMSLNIVPSDYVKEDKLGDDKRSYALVGTGPYQHTEESKGQSDFLLLKRFDQHFLGTAKITH